MTTARERYEKKTKVVTFRVSLDVYAQLEEIKAKGGLSYSDLVKLGAGIGHDEITAKLARVSGLEERESDLDTRLEDKEERLTQFVEEERHRRLTELDIEMEAFRLYDRRWSVDEVACKLRLPKVEAERYFDRWGEHRKAKRRIQTELLRRCLEKHIAKLKSRRFWVMIVPEYSQEDVNKVDQEIDYCQWMLSRPWKLSREWKEFLLAEYSGQL